MRATIASRWCARRAAPARTPPLHSLLPLFTSPLSLSSIPCFPASPSCAISLLRCHIQSDISSSRVFFPSLVLAFICSPPYARLHMLGPVFASICRPLCLLASTRPPFPRPLRSLLSQATALLHPARRPAHSRHHCCQTPPMRRCAGPDAVPRTRVHSD